MAKRKPKAPPPNDRDDQDEFEFPHLVRGDQVRRKRVTWCWKGRIRENALNIIDGDMGVGKSTLLSTLAATISRGGKFPGERQSCRPGAVLWFCSEEEFDSDVVPRFTANDGESKMLHNWPNAQLDGREKILLPHDVLRLSALLKKIGASVLVVDPFSCMAGPNIDMNSEQQTRGYLESMAAATVPLQVTTLLCRHWKKGFSTTVGGKGIGSVAIAAVCRSQLAATLDPETGKPGVLSTVKVNNCEIPKPISFKLQKTLQGEPWLWWGEYLDKTAREILELNEQGGEEDASNDAEMMLRKILKNGKVLAKEIVKEAGAVGISPSTLRRAKKRLRIKSQRVSIGSSGEGHHYWLPIPESPPPGGTP